MSTFEQQPLCDLLLELPVAFLGLTKRVLLQVKLLDEVLIEVVRPKDVHQEEEYYV